MKAVGRGEVFGLLSPNGADKTTTLETAEGRPGLWVLATSVVAVRVFRFS